MNAIRRMFCTSALVVVTLADSGCGSSQPTRYYSLEPEAASKLIASNYSGPAIQIATFVTPALFDRDELLKQTDAGQFEVLEFDHWAAPFGQMARQTFAEDLAKRLPAGTVVFPGSPVPANTVSLAVNLQAYRLVDHHALLQISWSYRDPADATGTWATRSASLQTDSGDGGGAATAAAVDDLLGQLADQIAAALPRH